MDVKAITSDKDISRIWERFSELSAIPRPSKDEGKAADYLEQFAKDKGFEVERDAENNILIKLPATRGFEKAPGIILQGHSDMVCVANEGFENPKTGGVTPKLSDDKKWITTEGTTLGADNGIGVASFLSLLEDEELEHGPLALLITTDEETGLNGANKLSFNFSDYTYLINGDSEDWGEAVIGCAGGQDSIVTFKGKRQTIESHAWFTLSVSGLQGGHSALAIAAPGRANAIDLLAGILLDVSKEVGIHIMSVQGGTARNVIPSEASVTFVVDSDNPDFLEVFDKTLSEYKKELTEESSVEFEFAPAGMTGEVFTIDDTQRLLQLIDAIPHGVEVWADDAETVPQTSTNLATISTDNDSVIITNMSRSSIESELDMLCDKIAEVAQNHTADIAHEGKYPGWEPISDSLLVETTKRVYQNLYASEIHITQTHGGLECGIIRAKYPHLMAISLGPTIEGAHSTKERVEVDSVAKFYELLKGLVLKLSQ